MFLISCFQYILCGIVLGAGPPFRQPVKNNSNSNLASQLTSNAKFITVPFVVTIAATILFSLYMLLDPGTWLADLMDLTRISIYFKLFILILALAGFVCAWVAEKHVFRWITRLVGEMHDTIWPQHRKIRKQYKKILQDMRV